ncbi:MAG: glycosyltransferase family 4 protein [Bacteroidales bacterium]
MKVLMFGWEFPPHITGGLGTACFGLTKGLLNQGVEVVFVVPKAYGDENQQAVRLLNASEISIDIKNSIYKDYWENISYIEVGSNLVPYLSPDEFYNIINQRNQTGSSIHESITANSYQFSGKYGQNLMEEVQRYALVASTIAAKNNFDVIHAHDWLTFPAGIAAKKSSNKPLIIHVHATEFDRSGENVNQNVYDIERQGMEAANLIIAVSNLTRNIIIERYGISPDKVITVYNAVEPTSVSENNFEGKFVKEKIVTFLGRVTFQKGPDYFVEAAYKVIKKDPNVRFVMAGSGDMLNRMIRLVAKLRISNKFHFTGFLDAENVDRMFSMTDVYVMPSVSEPFGISPLEAMHSNVPVVISKQSGVSEVLRHALKIDFWDIDAMADAIYGLLHYDALSKMFVRYGKDEVDNMKWDNAASLVKDVYIKALN